MMLFRMAALLQALLLVTVTSLPARAATLSTQAYLVSQRATTEGSALMVALQRDEVRAQLEAFGVPPELALERASALTPAELAAISERIERLPAGGDILGVIGIVFVVLIILEVVGVTNVFNAL